MGTSRHVRRARLSWKCAVIYVTVGTQLPFDRLVRTVDAWAVRNKRDDLFAQIGKSSFEPSALSWSRFLSPGESLQMIRKASIIVSHAGIGTILTSLENRKPIIILPRRMALGEHRSDHQVATARHFARRGLAHVVEDEEALSLQLDRLDSVKAGTEISPYAEKELIEFISGILAKL